MKFREVQTNLGLELKTFPDKSVEFVKKLTTILSQGDSVGEYPVEIPFKRAVVEDSSKSAIEDKWFGAEPGDSEAYSMKRVRRRIEKEI